MEKSPREFFSSRGSSFVYAYPLYYLKHTNLHEKYLIFT